MVSGGAGGWALGRGAPGGAGRGMRRRGGPRTERIGVLMGGPSAEREISMRSGGAVVAALDGAGWSVVPVVVDGPDPERLRALGITTAFVALHGAFGEDGAVQGMLEELGLPYTGSGVAASRLAFDKVAARLHFVRWGLQVARAGVVQRDLPLELPELRYPVVVKPARQGSSIGLSIVDDPADVAAGCALAFRYDERALVEELVPGREVTVGVLGEEPLPVIEIRPHRRCYDFAAKYTDAATEFLIPGLVTPADAAVCQAVALEAHQRLGCCGVSRVDMILTDHGIPVVLEVNTIPGLTARSLLPRAAAARGLSFGELCVRILELAWAARGIAPARPQPVARPVCPDVAQPATAGRARTRS